MKTETRYGKVTENGGSRDLSEAIRARDARCLLACSLVWQRGGDIKAGRELASALSRPDPVWQTIAEVGLVEAGLRSIALIEAALEGGQLQIEDGGSCLHKLLLAGMIPCSLLN